VRFVEVWAVCSVCGAGRRFGVCQWRFGLSANPVCFQFFSVSVLDVVTQPRGGGRREAPIYEDNTSHVWGGGPERAYPTEQDVLKKSCPLQKSSVLAHFLAMGSIVAP
jgi:hypothetical protein